jgi:hypothetical protein
MTDLLRSTIDCIAGMASLPNATNIMKNDCVQLQRTNIVLLYINRCVSEEQQFGC